MAEPDQILDTLQADIVELVKNVPALEHAYVFTGNEKDLATRLQKTFATRTNTGGKRGLGVQVLPIFVEAAESNLPGPPLKLKIQILVIENLTINRAGATGTMKTTSQAALNIVAALHLHGIGPHTIYADSNPVAPEKIEDGFEAHLVTLYVRADGLQGPGKPSAVEVELEGGFAATLTVDPADDNNAIEYTANKPGAAGNNISMTYDTPTVSAETAVSVTGSAITVTPGTKAVMVVSGMTDAAINGVYQWVSTTRWDHVSGGFHINKLSELFFVFNSVTGEQVAQSDHASSWPDQETWTPLGSFTGSPSVAAANSTAAQIIAAVNAHGSASALVTASNAPGNDGTGSVTSMTLANLSGGTDEGGEQSITLTCATAGAAIRYTTDGSFPTPSNGTLYSAPFAPPPVGTKVRAAAYVSGLNPSDCLEFTITE